MPRLLTYFGLLTRDDAGKWFVSFPDVSGCSAHGKSIEATRRMAEEQLRRAVAREIEATQIAPKASDRATVANYALAKGAMLLAVQIANPPDL